jgi:hypothetical protein
VSAADAVAANAIVAASAMAVSLIEVVVFIARLILRTI